MALYDLKNAGLINNNEQCREALMNFVNSEFDFTKAQEAFIPTKEEMITIMNICDDVLPIKPQ